MPCYAAECDDSCRLASYCSRQGPWLQQFLVAHDYLLWLPALLRADGGRGVGDPRPGLTGRFRGGEATVMPLASSLGASHDPQSDAPLRVNSCVQLQQLVMTIQTRHNMQTTIKLSDEIEHDSLEF